MVKVKIHRLDNKMVNNEMKKRGRPRIRTPIPPHLRMLELAAQNQFKLREIGELVAKEFDRPKPYSRQMVDLVLKRWIGWRGWQHAGAHKKVVACTRRTKNERKKRGRKPKFVSFSFDRPFTIDDVFRRCEKAKNKISKIAISVKLKKLVATGEARVVGKVECKKRGRPFLLYALRGGAGARAPQRMKCESLLRLPNHLSFTVRDVHACNLQRSPVWVRCRLNQMMARGQLEAVDVSAGVGRPLRLYGWPMSIAA